LNNGLLSGCGRKPAGGGQAGKWQGRRHRLGKNEVTLAFIDELVALIHKPN
jgi:hypothetical protein